MTNLILIRACGNVQPFTYYFVLNRSCSSSCDLANHPTKTMYFVTATMFQNVSNPHDNPSDRYDINNNFAQIMSVVGFCALVLLCGSVQFTSEV
jgi:hypothetical protein